MARFEDETVDWLFDATGWWIAQLGGYDLEKRRREALTRLRTVGPPAAGPYRSAAGP